MAEVRPFRALRYDAAKIDPALAIAPPYDVISPSEQRALYERSAHNIVRVEYGEKSDGDTADDSRYTRAARDLAQWQADGVLTVDERPAIYCYRQEFSWGGERHVRRHYFGVVRLEPWGAGVVKPHERTLSGPKADRMELLRATRTQVSPVYCLYRERTPSPDPWPFEGGPLYDFESDEQRHVLTAITDDAEIAALSARFAACDFYIADGHHRYETALAYRDEMRAKAPRWTGEEAANFVLMAATDYRDGGLLVLPTHRIVTPPVTPADAMARIAAMFRVERIEGGAAEAALAERAGRETAFVAVGLEASWSSTVGLEPGALHLLTLIDRAAAEALMPADQPDAWKRLDVSVLQYAVLRAIYGIDDAVLAAGTALRYTQEPAAAIDAVASGAAPLAFLLNATPVTQVLEVSDVSGRMPQKSTYFYPKLPTGLVLHGVG